MPLPGPEHDAGPPPLPRAPEHARRPVELVSEIGVSLPTCRDDFVAERCTALAPAIGATLLALHRPNPFLAFGGGVSYARSNAFWHEGRSEGRLVAVGAWGRVYFHEEGVFDPYLELELGYGALSTTFVEASGVRREETAFGPRARVGGGLEFSVFPSLRLGGSVGFSRLLFDHGAACGTQACAPGGAMVGALGFGLRATVLIGDEL